MRKIIIIALLCSAIITQWQDGLFSKLEATAACVASEQAGDDPPSELEATAADTVSEEAADDPSSELEDDPFAELGDDPFADLEADAADTAAKKEAGTFGKLVENLGGKAVVQYTAFFNDREKQTGSDNKNHFGNTTLDLETWTSGQDWRVDISTWLQAGTQDKTFSGTSPGGTGNFFRDTQVLDNSYATLNELYLTLNFDSWDLTLGKKIAKNGLSTLYSPADTLRPVAGFDPLNVHDLGVWQAWADIYRGDFTWTVAVLPVYQPDIMPHSSSRWVNAPAGGEISSDYPDIDPKDFGWFGRVKTVKNGFDLFASIYVGPSRQYVVKQVSTVPVTGEQKIPDVVKSAGGYSTTRGRWEVHGEIANTNSLHGEDEDYIAFVQGTTLTMDGDRISALGLEQILATLEVAWEWRTDYQRASHFVTSSDSARAGQSDLINRLQFKVNEDVSLEYSGHFILEDWGYANRFGGKRKIMNNLIWHAGFEFFGGSAGGGPAAGLNSLSANYGGWKRNNRFISAFEYKF